MVLLALRTRFESGTIEDDGWWAADSCGDFGRSPSIQLAHLLILWVLVSIYATHSSPGKQLAYLLVFVNMRRIHRRVNNLLISY